MALGRTLAAFVYWLALSHGLGVPSSHVVHERVETLHPRWVKGERVHPDAWFPMRVGLAQANLDKAHGYLLDVSHPSSDNYGKYWTPEQVVEAFKPPDETVETVRKWLVDNGIPFTSIIQSDNKGWLAFHATAGQAESLLHTEYFEHEDMFTGGIMPACSQYHVPRDLREHIDYITPGVRLLAPLGEQGAGRNDNRERSVLLRGTRTKYRVPPKPMPRNASDLTTCDVAITPACIAALYQIPPSHPTPHPNSSLGVFESELQFWAQKDLDSFFTNFTSHITNGTHPINVQIDGGVARTTNLSAAGGESELDLQLAYPIVYPQKITVFNVDDLFYQNWANDTYSWGFNTFLDAIDGSYCTYSAYGEKGDAPDIDPTYPNPHKGGYKGRLQCGIYKPTNVISLSYGGQEADVPIAYQKRQCNEYLKLGLQGVSFIFASGDSGVGSYPAPYGFDGKTGCLGPKHNIFNPTWPVNCPYVTSVGATKVYPGHTVYEPESAVLDPAGHPYHTTFSSGGGFSNVYARPDYQASALASFFAKHNPPYPHYSALAPDAPNPTHLNVTALAGNSNGIYNRIGRGVPDVAANGDNIATYIRDKYMLSGGTSASAPIFASIINRLVEERLAVGKGPLGFLNHALYANPWVLNDIVNGSNPDCGTEGFKAEPGWDPVTGLGTPNYPRMRKLFVEQLP